MSFANASDPLSSSACLSCADSPLSVTASVIGILTFANSLLIGLLLFVRDTGKRILETPAELREFIEHTDAQFDELRDAQTWVEQLPLYRAAHDDRQGPRDPRRRRRQRRWLQLQHGQQLQQNGSAPGTPGPPTRTSTTLSTDSSYVDAVGKQGYGDRDGYEDCKEYGGGTAALGAVYGMVGGGGGGGGGGEDDGDDDDDSYYYVDDDDVSSIGPDVRQQAVKLLDKAQLSFIASQRYLMRYGKILDEDTRPAGQLFRKARFVAAKEDVARSTEIRTRALQDFRHFRTRIEGKQTQRDRELLRQQTEALQTILGMLKAVHVGELSNMDGDGKS